MAGQDVTTNIVAKADFSNLIGNLNRLTSSLTKLQQQVGNSNRILAGQIGQMNKSFAETLRSTGQFSTHFVSLSSDVEKFGSQLDKGQLKLNQYFKVWQNHTKTSAGLVRDLAKQQVQLQNAVVQPLGKNAQGLMQYNVHIPQGLDLIKNKTALAKQELQIMNKVMQQGAGQLINWGKNTQWAGRQLTVGLTVPIAAFGKAAADAFKQADEQLVRLTKVYGGLSATSTTELAKVRKDVSATAAELSKSYGVSFKDTLGLAADIAATGKTGNELLGSIKETTRLSVLGEVDRQDAMKATLALQNGFKQNTDQLAESINFLNAVENQTSTTLGDLIIAIPKAGPVIEGMGGSVKDLALYLTAMKEGGINATEGANALKSSIASLINPTKVAVGMFRGFGIDLGGIVTKNAGNLTGTILELQKALDTLNPLQKQQAIEQLFGKFQFARMNALFANLGKQGSQTLQVMDLMKASSQELAGVATRELGQVTESASGKYRRAVEGLKADLAQVGDQFLAINTHLINFVDGIIKFTQHLPGPIKQVLGFMGMLTAAAGPLIMLTGVLGNFFGYIIKGAYHFKSLFRGGEGWKLLTPEIIAANNAGSLIEKTFYSDAKAAAVLKQAISNLSAEIVILQQKANAGAISTLPALQRAGGMITGGGDGREVNPNHPLISAQDTRSMSHMIQRNENQPNTMFGVLPGAPKVNQKISDNPQMYMQGDLPKIPGLTSIRGVSTGVVAEEAAKWHSMTAAIAMQSDAELLLLKQEIATTGTITAGLSDSYQALLPQMSLITTKAAQETAAIVAELQASKITVDQARAKVIALNAEIEMMMASTATSTAASMGRTIDVTKVPLVDQPVIDAAGKSNMKELTRPGRTRDLLNKIARSLGVKTFGAPYSIETTIPKRLNSGGRVYTANDGSIVPGPNVNADVVPAMLTPGEFVVNKEATAANLPLLHAINGGERSAGYGNLLGGYMSSSAANAVLRMFGVASRSAKPSRLAGNWGMILPNAINRRLRYGRATGAELIPHLSDSKNLIDVESFLKFKGVDPSDIANVQSKIARQMKSNILANQMYGDPELGKIAFAAITPEIKALEFKYPGISLAYQKDRMSPGRRDTQSSSSSHGPSPTGINIPGGRRSSYASGNGTGNNRNVWAHFGDQEFDSNIAMLAQGYAAGGMVQMPQQIPVPVQNGKYNMGGMVQGYAAGGIIPNVLKSTAFKNLGARFGKIGESWGATSMSIGMGRKLFGSSGLTPKAQNLMYGKLIEHLEKERPYGYVKDAQGSLQKALEPHIVDGLLKSAAGDVLSSGGKNLSKIDREILRTKFANWDNKSWTPSTTKIRKQMFGMNKGGIVPGYLGGGMVGQMIGGTAGYLGGSMIGSSIGGNTGSMIGGMAGSMALPMIMSSIGSGATKAAPGVSKLKLALAGLRGIPGPTMAIAGLVTLGLTLKNVNDRINEHRKIVTLGFAPTEEAASKLGLKFKSLSSQMKDYAAATKLAAANNAAFYATTQTAGVKGLNLTIKQLQDLKKSVKQDFPDYIKIFNAAKPEEVITKAKQLKSQFIAGGMSADKASQLIYGIVTSSEKSFKALSILGDKGFANIKDKSGAASESINTFNRLLSAGNMDQLSAGFDQVLNSVQGYETSLIGTKDASGKQITQLDAMNLAIQKLNTGALKNVQIEQNGVDALSKQNSTLGLIVNRADTVAGVFAKIKLYLAGSNLDLKGMNSELATLALKTSASVGNAIFGSIQVKIDALKTKASAATKRSQTAMQDTQTSLNDEIKKHQKIIDQIKAQADARIKAIQKENDAESAITQIKKAQLEYQQAIASGDMAGAARAQLDIQSLSSQRQNQAAIDSINNKADRDTQKQQDIIDVLQSKIDGLQKQVTTLSKSAVKDTTTADSLQNLLDRANAASLKIAGKSKIGQADKENLSKISKDFITAGMPEYAAMFKQGKDGKYPIQDTFMKTMEKALLADGSLSVTDQTLMNYFIKTKFGDTKTDTPSGYKMGAVKPVAAETLKDAVKAAQGGKIQAATWVQNGTDQAFSLFQWKGKTYAVDKLTGTNVYLYDSLKNDISGKRLKFAPGGPVYGAGTGTSDSIPAMLSHGEYVINAASVQAAGLPLLNKINKMAAGGLATKYNIPNNSMTIANSMPGFKNGGIANSSNATIGNTYYLTNNINGYDGDLNQLSTLVTQKTVNAINSMNAVGATKVGTNRMII